MELPASSRISKDAPPPPPSITTTPSPHTQSAPRHLLQVGRRPLVTRQAYYEHAVLMSLVPLMNSELYPEFELPVLGCQPGGTVGT